MHTKTSQHGTPRAWLPGGIEPAHHFATASRLIEAERKIDALTGRIDTLYNGKAAAEKQSTDRAAEVDTLKQQASESELLLANVRSQMQVLLERCAPSLFEAERFNFSGMWIDLSTVTHIKASMAKPLNPDGIEVEDAPESQYVEKVFTTKEETFDVLYSRIHEGVLLSALNRVRERDGRDFHHREGP